MADSISEFMPVTISTHLRRLIPCILHCKDINQRVDAVTDSNSEARAYRIRPIIQIALLNRCTGA